MLWNSKFIIYPCQDLYHTSIPQPVISIGFSSHLHPDVHTQLNSPNLTAQLLIPPSFHWPLHRYPLDLPTPPHPTPIHFPPLFGLWSPQLFISNTHLDILIRLFQICSSFASSHFLSFFFFPLFLFNIYIIKSLTTITRSVDHPCVRTMVFSSNALRVNPILRVSLKFFYLANLRNSQLIETKQKNK